MSSALFRFRARTCFYIALMGVGWLAYRFAEVMTRAAIPFEPGDDL